MSNSIRIKMIVTTALAVAALTPVAPRRRAQGSDVDSQAKAWADRRHPDQREFPAALEHGELRRDGDAATAFGRRGQPGLRPERGRRGLRLGASPRSSVGLGLLVGDPRDHDGRVP